MSDLKALAEKAREREQIGVALVFSVLALGGVVFFFPKHDGTAAADTPAAVALATTTPPDAYANLAIEGKAAIVVDLSTGLALYEKNADAQLPLASLTKLLTMYAAVSTLSPDSIVTITPTAIAEDGDYGLSAGEQFRFEDIAKFALVGSSNDAAEAIAEAAENHLAVNTESMMANVASAVGLSQTYAMNGTGLDESDTVSGGYGSARDVARLAAALLEKAPDIASATTKPSITVSSLAGVSHSLPNTDTEIGRFPNLLLSKTGYTDLAGGNLAIIFDAGINHPVAVVVLGSTEDARFTDVDTLVAATLAHFAGTAPQS